MDIKTMLQPQAAECLQAWHAMIAQRDLSGLPELLHPQAVFRSPMAHKPYEGAPAVNLILNTVLQVFEGFRYHRELASAEGRDVVLEFSARVGDRELKGIDLIRFDETGRNRIRGDGSPHERLAGTWRRDEAPPRRLWR